MLRGEIVLVPFGDVLWSIDNSTLPSLSCSSLLLHGSVGAALVFDDLSLVIWIFFSCDLLSSLGSSDTVSFLALF